MNLITATNATFTINVSLVACNSFLKPHVPMIATAAGIITISSPRSKFRHHLGAGLDAPTALTFVGILICFTVFKKLV
jgi:hypothetical protein